MTAEAQNIYAELGEAKELLWELQSLAAQVVETISDRVDIYDLLTPLEWDRFEGLRAAILRAREF